MRTNLIWLFTLLKETARESKKLRIRLSLKPICAAMIGLSFLAPAFAAASLHSNAPFCGFNISGGIGVEMPNYWTKATLHIAVPAILETELGVNHRMTTNTFAGGVRVGYSNVFKRCYLIGIAGDATFGDSLMRFEGLVFEPGSSLGIPTNTAIKLSNQFALLFKFGGLVCDRTLIYGLIGPRWGRMSFNTDASYSQNVGVILSADLQTSDDAYRMGLLLGLGTEFMLTKCISLALEYTNTNYMNPGIPGAAAAISQDGVELPGSTFELLNSFSARSNEIMIRLGYYY